MSAPGRISSAPPAPVAAADAERAKLRRAAHAFEGLFLRRLFEAMRSGTGQEGLTGHSPGGQMFTSMLDDALADRAAERMENGLGDALYRQLSRRIQPAPAQTPVVPAREP